MGLAFMDKPSPAAQSPRPCLGSRGVGLEGGLMEGKNIALGSGLMAKKIPL